jgi:uncharacterized protein (DUF3084 family)
MAAPATAPRDQLSIEQEIARLQHQIDTQTQKLGTVRRNNVKQIQRSITTRQEKVEMLRNELARVGETPFARNQEGQISQSCEFF